MADSVVTEKSSEECVSEGGSFCGSQGLRGLVENLRQRQQPDKGRSSWRKILEEEG